MKNVAVWKACRRANHYPPPAYRRRAPRVDIDVVPTEYPSTSLERDALHHGAHTPRGRAGQRHLGALPRRRLRRYHPPRNTAPRQAYHLQARHPIPQVLPHRHPMNVPPGCMPFMPRMSFIISMPFMTSMPFMRAPQPSYTAFTVTVSNWRTKIRKEMNRAEAAAGGTDRGLAHQLRNRQTLLQRSVCKNDWPGLASLDERH